jgi:hypothetical protein
MAGKSKSPDPEGRNGWLHNVAVPLAAAAILALGGVIGALVTRDSGGNDSGSGETTTVVETVPGTEPESHEQAQPQAPETEAGATLPQSTTACLPSKVASDSEDNSIGTPRGPLVSGQVYRGTLIKGDEEWWGFCAARPGRVDVRVENVCSVQGSGATNLIADVLGPSEEELESFRPDPGGFDSIPLQVEANVPYYVHIYDLDDIDIGGICSEVPWAMVVTGDLTAEVAS